MISSSQHQAAINIKIVKYFIFLFFLYLTSACEKGKRRSLDLEPDQSLSLIDMSVTKTDQSPHDHSLPLDLNSTDMVTDGETLPEYPLDENQIGTGIFRKGCPKVGFAHARLLEGPGELSGEAVIADQGDVLLMNERVAFVIQDPTQTSRTWWYYGGQIVDAVPLKNCQQSEEDRLNSLGMVLGEGEITALDQAVMRAFKGERIEIIHDGSGGGEARVRVHGQDAPMWLVEFELLSRAMKAGRPRLRSDELGVSMWVDIYLTS